MTHRYFPIILLLVLFSSCKEKPVSNRVNNLRESRFEYKQYHNPIFYEIERFTLKHDSIPLHEELVNVIIVDFNKSHDSLFMNLETCYYYPNNPEYYYFIEDYLIGFYHLELWRSNELIKKFPTNKIPKETYKSENEVHFRPFEPTIRKYLITNNDSLLLLKEIIY